MKTKCHRQVFYYLDQVLKVPNEKHEELRTVLDRLGFAQSGMIGGLITAHTTMAQVLPEERETGHCHIVKLMQELLNIFNSDGR